MNHSICFITTGDITNIATAKRALGLANPLSDLGWKVYIVMEDCDENRHRCALECDSRISIHFFSAGSMLHERKVKEVLIHQINPDYLYICAFVARNIVGLRHHSSKLVEHCELQSHISDINVLRKLLCYLYEFSSILYADALLNASHFLQVTYRDRSKRLFRPSLPMLYFPYAYNPDVIQVVDVNLSQPKYKRFQGKINLVFIGSVVRGYGIFTILEAVEQIRTQVSCFNMLILGRGKDFDAAKAYVAEKGLDDVVYLPGYIAEEEISDYLSMADAFVSPMNDTPQDWARCPSKIYLYMPYRRPVITCRIGEPLEALLEEGYYYEPGNSQSLASQMLRVIQGPFIETDVDPKSFTWQTRATELTSFIQTLQ